MFYSKSIYALNKKDRDAIVYEDADGSLIRLRAIAAPWRKGLCMNTILKYSRRLK